MQGLVATARTLTESGESCCISVSFSGQGVGVSSRLRSRREAGASRWSLQVEPLLDHQSRLSSCKENFVASRGSHVVVTEQSLCPPWPQVPLSKAPFHLGSVVSEWGR